MNNDKKYKTIQKDEILNFFKNHCGECFTAKDIISNTEIDVGEATVYRCLSGFAKDGTLKKFIGSSSDGALYQYNLCSHSNHEHFHLKCLKCGKLIHLECTFLKEMEQHIQQTHNFTVDNTTTTIYGLCENCRDDKTKRIILKGTEK